MRLNQRTTATRPYAPGCYLLRRWWRVRRNILRCFFLDMRLRRFLMTEPMGFLPVVSSFPQRATVENSQHHNTYRFPAILPKTNVSAI